MDELKLKLSTKFMRGMIAKFIAKFLAKKLGFNIDILINEIELRHEDGKIKLHADVDAEINNDDFMKLVKQVGMD